MQPDEPLLGEPGQSVLVIGGGMGGIQAALDLAEAGRHALIVDHRPSIGGLMTQLDRTFPTNNCDLCTLSPNLSEGGRQQRISLLELTQVTALRGEAGRFEATLTSLPRHIDLEKCTACGVCFDRFPECVTFHPGLDHRAPTCMRYPQATPHAYAIDLSRCKDVAALVACCPAAAIQPEDVARERTFQCGAVILATGADVYTPGPGGFMGHGEWPDVVTSLEYERILSATGPTRGALVRPSDGRAPEKIAWIQCSGSRSLQPQDVPYCSSACCMFALKEAMVTKERFQGSIDTAIFYMDLRTAGKDYERYMLRARDEHGVRLVRCRTNALVHHPDTGRFTLRYATFDTEEPRCEDFDMVVLATGFRVPRAVRDLAAVLSVELDRYGFVRTGDRSPVSTSRAGIYACGLCEGPKDIPETLVQASAAASQATTHLTPVASQETAEELPPERDVSGVEPRIGIFVCDCGEDIGGVVDVPSLVKNAARLPGVVHAEAVGWGCSRESLLRIQASIGKHRLNRVVVGGCSPRTHERKFQDALRQEGLNPYLLDIANLRDQDAWVHHSHPRAATAKALDLLAMSAAAVTYARALPAESVLVNRDVLVVGGGVAGMTAALTLANRGLKVYLVEREDVLGGQALKVHRTLSGLDVQAWVHDLVEKTTAHPDIQVLTRALVVDHAGSPGSYTTGLQLGPGMHYRQIQHGITILATGALANRPALYGLGEHPSIMTQRDLDGLLEERPEAVEGWQNAVMIQCVGSRTPENPNCSRICCQGAMKNALRLLERLPNLRLFVLYRDIRTLGTDEDAYLEARRRGAIFVRYDPEHPPVVDASGEQPTVTFTEPLIGEELQLAVDALLLSTGMVADDESTEDLASLFHLTRTADGFFLEDHIKLRPVDLTRPGFFVAGTAHSPKSLKESTTQAFAVAARAEALLAQPLLERIGPAARVDQTRCASCLICVRACPYQVPFINAEGHSEIDPARCHACGICAAECPAKAIQLPLFEDIQISAKLTALFAGRSV